MSNVRMVIRCCGLVTVVQIAIVSLADSRAVATQQRAALPGETMHLGFESEEELLADFVSQSRRYVRLGREGLREERELLIEKGRFGNGLRIRNGWPVSQGTWNESGLDCDLIVAVMWGEWHRKPHFWGSGRFHGDRGTVAFWVKSDTFRPGIVFMQGNVAWGRKERDLLTIEVDKDRRLSAFIRDVYYENHRVVADSPTWLDGQWQHIAVTYDRGYGLKLYHNGKFVGSTWGQDAWWQTPLPGLFSPFLPESSYDELWFFDHPLSEEQVASLYERNSFEVPAEARAVVPFDDAARERLLGSYADLDQLELPTLAAGDGQLCMKQAVVEECHDETIPAGWVLDGRYELPWPHPYLMFTFILGDVDFHGTKVELDLAPAERPNYISFEGILDDMTAVSGEPGSFDHGKKLVHLRAYDGAFYSRKIDLAGATALLIPLVKGYGSPAGLQGSAKLPLTGKTRIHELTLWNAEPVGGLQEPGRAGVTAYLRPVTEGAMLERYGPALARLKCSRDRTVVTSETGKTTGAQVPLDPLSSVHLFGPGLHPDMAVDAIGLHLPISPAAESDVIWCKVRDPANPSRIWAQTCIRVEFEEGGRPQPVNLTLDIIDLMLADEDRLWVEIVSANGGQLILGDPQSPAALVVYPSADREKALAEYVRHEMLPARLQYSKEYNYMPWKWIDRPINIRQWDNFGGPFDMAHPPLAVLRHDPDNRIANAYRELNSDRRSTRGEILEGGARRSAAIDAAPGAPAWAVWQRELYAFNRKAAHWIAGRQRADGMFWGGANDDSFIPLGYAAFPLMGDEITRKAWLRFYEGLEEAGIYADGYCDIWPIDPLHITDYITSRGLTLAFALGDPYVLEREMRTAQRYMKLTQATNAKRAEEGLLPLTGDYGDRSLEKSTPIQQMEAQVAKYSSTHVRWYWHKTAKPEPYVLEDRAALAQKMMNVVLACDKITLLNRTEAMVHTDSQGSSFGRDELIAAALGGRLQGRIEAHPHSIAVSWEGNDSEDLARLVSYADDEKLTVSLYNFGDRPTSVDMRVWRLGPGIYEIDIGQDADDDGVIDDAAQKDAARREGAQRRELRRFSVVPVTVPPQQEYTVSVAQIEALAGPADLPDLAVSRRDLRVHDEGTLEVTVHNIGAAPARDVAVELINRAGQVVAAKTIALIESPCDDFRARKKVLRFTGLEEPDGLGVRLRCGEDSTEILAANNVVSPPFGSGR